MKESPQTHGKIFLADFKNKVLRQKAYVKYKQYPSAWLTIEMDGREFIEGEDFELQQGPPDEWTPTYNNPDDPPIETYAVPIMKESQQTQEPV